MKLKDLNENLARELQDPEFASCYLKYALEENGVEGFLIALGNAIRANQGMSQLTTKTELGRESLYRAFSESANPQFSMVYKTLSALGLQISIEPISSDGESEKSSLSSHP